MAHRRHAGPIVLLGLAYLAVTTTVTVLRLLPMSDRDKASDTNRITSIP